MPDPVRVVVWSTGGIGSIAVRAVAENPGLELVGVWVHSADKDGRDAGELVGIGPIGVIATNDAQAADNHDRVIALIESQTTSIGEVPAGMMLFEDDPIDHIEDSPDLPPLWQVFGASKRADGHWQLGDITAEYGSPDGALHLGPQHIVLETAAIDLAADLVGTDRLQMQTWHVMHLSRGKVGPFRVDGTAFAHQDGSGRVGAQLTLHDEGNGDRAVTGAAAVFCVVP
jgi:Dihydrodipicolinate reductase, N-terminus